jgi:glutamate-1-semialdehyde aminotransferase
VMASMENRSISITYGGEALSLAAALASIRELRDKRVNAYLWELGETLQRGLNDAAQEAAIPFHCGGLAPMTTMSFTETGGQPEELLWEYLLQEMAARGVLLRRGGLNFLTFSHTPTDLAQVIQAAAEVFSNLRVLWGRESIADAVMTRKHQLT